jgi:hypothetical protein
VDQEGEEEDLEDEGRLVAIGRRRVREPRHDPADALLRRDGHVREDPLNEARIKKHDDEPADHAEGQGDRDRREPARIAAEDADAEGQGDQEGEEDAREAADLLDELRRRHLDGLAAEACRVEERVAVEPGGRGQKGPDGAADQERPEQMHEGQLDALPAQHQLPAVHGREHPDHLDAGREPDEEPEGRRIDQRQLVADQLKRDHLLPRLDLDRMRQQRPEAEHGEPCLQDREEPGSRLAPGHAQPDQGQDRDHHGLNQGRHRARSPPRLAASSGVGSRKTPKGSE